MGTRALTFVYDTSEEPLVCMYSQWDGYPDDLGKDLAKFINSRQLVNGLHDDCTTTANGMDCLAALIVANFKGNNAGGFYLYPISTKDADQEYEYHIFENRVSVIDSHRQEIFKGDWKSFLDYCNNYE